MAESDELEELEEIPYEEEEKEKENLEEEEEKSNTEKTETEIDSEKEREIGESGTKNAREKNREGEKTKTFTGLNPPKGRKSNSATIQLTSEKMARSPSFSMGKQLSVLSSPSESESSSRESSPKKEKQTKKKKEKKNVTAEIPAKKKEKTLKQKGSKRKNLPELDATEKQRENQDLGSWKNRKKFIYLRENPSLESAVVLHGSSQMNPSQYTPQNASSHENDSALQGEIPIDPAFSIMAPPADTSTINDITERTLTTSSHYQSTSFARADNLFKTLEKCLSEEGSSSSASALCLGFPEHNLQTAKTMLLEILNKDVTELPKFHTEMVAALTVLGRSKEFSAESLANFSELLHQLHSITRSMSDSSKAIQEAKEKLELKDQVLRDIKTKIITYNVLKVADEVLAESETVLITELEKIRAERNHVEGQVLVLEKEGVECQALHTKLNEILPDIEASKVKAKETIEQLKVDWAEFKSKLANI